MKNQIKINENVLFLRKKSKKALNQIFINKFLFKNALIYIKTIKKLYKNAL